MLDMQISDMHVIDAILPQNLVQHHAQPAATTATLVTPSRHPRTYGLHGSSKQAVRRRERVKKPLPGTQITSCTKSGFPPPDWIESAEQPGACSETESGLSDG